LQGVIKINQNYFRMKTPDFSASEWLRKFRKANERYLFRSMRADIFQQTVNVVRDGAYILDGKEIIIDRIEATRETKFYSSEQILHSPDHLQNTQVSVIHADCVEVAALLSKTGYNVCMLNMANRQNPGGDVLGGAGAQEENLFRRSNIFLSLYQFADYSQQYGVERNTQNSYPLDRDFGAVYSRKVTFFRAAETSGYDFLSHPFQLSVISVPAISRPALELRNGEYFISENLVAAAKRKIRTILSVAALNAHDAVVLSAFCCGAFHNPPKHIAQLFREVLEEAPFINRFKLIVFAIIDDHNSWLEHNPEGNILPFGRAFESM